MGNKPTDRRRFLMASAGIIAGGLALPQFEETERNPSRQPEQPVIRFEDLPGGMLIPAYFYPDHGGVGDRFELVARAADWLARFGTRGFDRLIAIVNVDSGPGTAADSSYESAINVVKSAGGSVIGYVATDYGKNGYAAITSEIDDWLSYYPALDGIFLDEWAGQEAANAGLFQDLFWYVTVHRNLGICFANPGVVFSSDQTNPDPAWWGTGFVLHEEEAVNSTNLSLPRWLTTRSHGAKGAVLIHNDSSIASATATIVRAKSEGARWFYVTDDVLDNPWDTLPGENSGGIANQWNLHWGNLVWAIGRAG